MTDVPKETFQVNVVDSRSSEIESEEQKENQFDVKQTETATFPDDFDWKGFEELHSIKSELEEKDKILASKEETIDNLQDALITLKQELEYIERQPVQTVAKDIAKKNRNLNILLRRERNSIRDLEKRLEEQSKSILELTTNQEKQETVNGSSKTTTKKKNEWKSKYSKMSEKYLLVQGEIGRVKAELNKTKAVLAKEIGDGTTDLNSLLKDDSGWRGRCEHIAILKTQVVNLKNNLNKERLKNLENTYTNTVAENLDAKSPEKEMKAIDRKYKNNKVKLKNEMKPMDVNLIKQEKQLKNMIETRRKEMNTLRESLNEKN
eukprot:UN06601